MSLNQYLIFNPGCDQRPIRRTPRLFEPIQTGPSQEETRTATAQEAKKVPALAHDLKEAWRDAAITPEMLGWTCCAGHPNGDWVKDGYYIGRNEYGYWAIRTMSTPKKLTDKYKARNGWTYTGDFRTETFAEMHALLFPVIVVETEPQEIDGWKKSVGKYDEPIYNRGSIEVRHNFNDTWSVWRNREVCSSGTYLYVDGLVDGKWSINSRSCRCVESWAAVKAGIEKANAS